MRYVVREMVSDPSRPGGYWSTLLGHLTTDRERAARFTNRAEAEACRKALAAYWRGSVFRVRRLVSHEEAKVRAAVRARYAAITDVQAALTTDNAPTHIEDILTMLDEMISAARPS